MVRHSPRARTWDESSTDAVFAWNEQATENVEAWGQQSALALLLAKIEELGELAEVVDEHASWEDTSEGNFASEIVADTAALGERTQGFLEQTTETLDGTPIPIEDRPDLGTLPDGREAFRSELDDDAALNIQLVWALDADEGGESDGE